MKRLRDPVTGREFWRLTDDPSVNHTHLYHNIDAMSGDGRYVAYGSDLPHFGHETTSARVYAFDLAEDLDRVAMDGSGRVETIYEGKGLECLTLPKANPCHDVLHVRRYDRDPDVFKLNEQGDPDARLTMIKPLNMIIMGTDGSDPHPVSNRKEWHHHNWSGDGEWYMLGPYRKRWNASPEERWEAWGIMRFTFDLPCPAKASIAVHAKAPAGKGGTLSGRVNQGDFRVFIAADSFTWTTITVDDSGRETTVKLAGENEIVLFAPMDRVDLDLVRMRLTT